MVTRLPKTEKEAKILGIFAHNMLGLSRSDVIKLCNRLVQLSGF